MDRTLVKNVIRETIKEIFNTISSELERSTNTEYVCEDQTIIKTDVGYVEDWFKDYKKHVYEKYQISEEEK